MLSSELLRTRINRGKITPLFCTINFGNGTEYELANKIILFFTNAQKNRQCKGDLLQKIGLLESEYDYKLVRGLLALLERRSVFGQSNSISSNATPMLVRKKLFEESSRRGLALSDAQRQDIIHNIASHLHISSQDVENLMWSDKDEHLELIQFDSLSPKDLILWYNLSLLQTLLFKCTRMEFYIKGGLYWKQVLRDVKKYGLMYSLEYSSENYTKNNSSSENIDSVSCILEGPFSLFKMTDRYGTSMAKLLPSITRTPTWRISGSIIKKTDDGQKIYSFELSSENTQEFLRTTIDVENQNNDDYVYDSSIEAAFAKRFQQHFDQNDKFGWKISREPNPLIADGKAMIPDFLFERFGRKVYLEIVGFWTREYLERKATKLKAILDDNANKKKVDLLVAINSELSCSQIETISEDRIFTFKKNVSIKPILEHLNKIDAEITEEKARDAEIKLDNKSDLDLIYLTQLAQQYAIPETAVLKILNSKYPDAYVAIGSYLISNKKTKSVTDSLTGVTSFVQACTIMKSHGIPDVCHADLLSKLGYDVIWNDLDPNNATVSRK